MGKDGKKESDSLIGGPRPAGAGDSQRHDLLQKWSPIIIPVNIVSIVSDSHPSRFVIFSFRL
jgi:hypothetical protein